MENIAEQLLYVTVRLQGETAKGCSVGTGFLYMHRQRLFVVTNKHVVKGITKGNMVLHQSLVEDEKSKPKLGFGHNVEFSEANFIGHPTDDIDITVMNLSEVIERLRQAGTPAYFKNIVEELRPKQEDIEKFISPVEDVVFIGYPSGIWDTKNLMPVVRKGITATPYYIQFESSPIFLIDASVFPGSSGSPVFLYYAGSYSDKTGGLYAGSKAYFLGIVARVFQRTEEGEITVKDVPTSKIPVAEVKQMIDLGIVFNDAAVVETMDHYLEKVGVPKIPSPSLNTDVPISGAPVS